MSISAVTSASLSLCATPDAVRETMRIASAAMELMKLDPELRGNAEIVLAEALNNVVEHAFANAEPGRIPGEIRVDLHPRKRGLGIVINDRGTAMPNLELPAGKLVDLPNQTEDLPEGGFGWFLFRELSRGLQYIRSNDSNRLQLIVPKPTSVSAKPLL